MPTPRQALWRFPSGALEHIESALQAIAADVVNYPALMGADKDSNVCVLVVLPDTPLAPLVRDLVQAKAGL